MKIALVYNTVERLSKNGYSEISSLQLLSNFVESYKKVLGTVSHQLVIVTSGGEISPAKANLLSEFEYEVIRYQGQGWDVGALVHASKELPFFDTLLFLNSQVQITSPRFLERFVESWEENGPGLYGASSSFEVSRHIRTSCIAAPPGVFSSYPRPTSSRFDATVFEHSPNSISHWAKEGGLNPLVVYSDETLPLDQSRSKSDIFRSGNQSKLMISDRHTRIYDEADESEKIRLQRLADGEFPANFRNLGPVARSLYLLKTGSLGIGEFFRFEKR